MDVDVNEGNTMNGETCELCRGSVLKKKKKQVEL